MPSIKHYLDPVHSDLVTPDGKIVEMTPRGEKLTEALLFIEAISPVFVGFRIDPELVFFNIKSTLAQAGVDGIGVDYELDVKNRCAQVKVELRAIGKLGEAMLKHLHPGAAIGKLFAADPRRRVRSPDYLFRMFGRADRCGDPLLSLGGLHGSDDLILDVVDGRCVAYLALQNGRIIYEEGVYNFLETIGKALMTDIPTRRMMRLYQQWNPHLPRNIAPDQLLLVRTLPLHIRTVYGRVVDSLLSEGYRHTSASILQPDTLASGDVYELFGESKREISDIPLEFYTLEPYREYVFFSDRDQLQSCLEEERCLFEAFKTAPGPETLRAAAFIVKSSQLLNLEEEDWIVKHSRPYTFPGAKQSARQSQLVERYMEQQPSYPFLKSINDGAITSQGILLERHFPSPLMKRMLIGEKEHLSLKGIYFQHPSQSHNGFFSAEDRALLHDLYTFAVPVHWVDEATGRVLRYVEKPERDTGMFVPPDKIDHFIQATLFGVYGSNLLEGNFEKELLKLLTDLLELKQRCSHPLFNREKPIALVTGGGPGAMEVGNRIAKQLGILSCANIVDFRRPGNIINEQRQNPYVEAKMTYRIDKLVERQSEFNLDFPIFLTGGIGTDFEFALEEVRRKVGAVEPTPIILFGEPEYWSEKITSRFQSNLAHGTIKGSEWLSNSFFCVRKAEQALEVYRQYFTGTLPIGKEGPTYPEGFVVC